MAFAKIEFAEASPELWKMALVAGLDESSLPTGSIFGFPVDTGVAAFLDMHTVNELLPSEASLEEVSHELLGQFDAHQVDTWTWAILGTTDSAHLISFSSGVGDGRYASYFGYSTMMKDPVCLISDFALFK